MLNLCKHFQCPYWAEKPNFGCSRFASAVHCIGDQIKNVQADEYRLNLDPGDLNGNIETLMKFTIEFVKKPETPRIKS